LLIFCFRNYKRKTDYKPLTDEVLDEARRLIAAGYSYRKTAKEIGFNETTLRTRLKKGGTEKLGRFRNTFTPVQEKELVGHCVGLDQRFFGLTLKSLRFLLFKYAEENGIPHQFTGESQLAGRDFTREFMKRNRLSLRIPRKTSIARAMGFNRYQLERYFDNLAYCLREYKFTPNQIYNMDETGVQTVPNKLPLHVAPTGKREVAKTVAAEQGQTVTAVCAMNAVGNYVPPYFIYSRKRENRQLIRGGPTGCDMAVTDKGYMNTPTFIKWLQHFEKHVNPSEGNKILLILDNHISHTSLEAVTYAKAHHIHLLTLPPHSSHKTQPLDRCFFGPLKTYYDAAVDAWDVSNPGQTFDIYSVAATFKIAFEKAGTIETAVQAFKATGISPFDRNIFVEADFLPSEVTDQQLVEENPTNNDEETDDAQRIRFPNDEDVTGNSGSETGVLKQIPPDQGPSTLTAQQSQQPEDVTIPKQQGSKENTPPDLVLLSNHDQKITSPNDIIPLPKIRITRKRRGKGLKSQLLTSTPNKTRLEVEAKGKEELAAEKERRAKERRERAEAKKRKLDFSALKLSERKKRIKIKGTEEDSSDSDGEFSLHDSSSDFNFSFSGEECDQQNEDDDMKDQKTLSLKPNDYAIVKVQGKTKTSFRHYVAKIISTYDDGGYEVVFYKKLPGAYKFTETKEESFIDTGDIVSKLSHPTCMQTARFHNALSFSEDLSMFKIF